MDQMTLKAIRDRIEALEAKAYPEQMDYARINRLDGSYILVPLVTQVTFTGPNGEPGFIAGGKNGGS